MAETDFKLAMWMMNFELCLQNDRCAPSYQVYRVLGIKPCPSLPTELHHQGQKKEL